MRQRVRKINMYQAEITVEPQSPMTERQAAIDICKNKVRLTLRQKGQLPIEDIKVTEFNDIVQDNKRITCSVSSVYVGKRNARIYAYCQRLIDERKIFLDAKEWVFPRFENVPMEKA